MNHISFRYFENEEPRTEKPWNGLGRITDETKGLFTQPIIDLFRDNPHVMQVTVVDVKGITEFVRDNERPTLHPYSNNNLDYVFLTEAEAKLVQERMGQILEQYECVLVADLKDLIGVTTTHVDNKWGWVKLNNIKIRTVDSGFMLDLPAPEPI